ncbi:MAG: GNAT family N-acetyltransferase [Betaproteobacteria bacterium]|nr:GNAT family N-acetyltransferase [Betaproteobacteria bacterium]
MTHTTGAAAELRIRRLTPNDLPAVTAIDASLGGRMRTAFHDRRLQAAQRAPNLYVQFAAEEKGRVVGYVLGRVLEGEFGRTAPAMRLEVIGVRADARGHGAGLALNRALEDEARKRGLHEMRTGGDWRDHTMMRFLDTAGYELARSHVIDCALGEALLGSRHEEPVSVEQHERPSDQNDYSNAAPNDFDQLARDTVEIGSLVPSDLEDVVRIDRRRTGHDRSAYIQHKFDDALKESAIRMSLVARKNGAAAGFLMASADYGNFGRAEPAAVLDTIGVDPNFAHTGVARAMLSQLFVNLGALRIERVETLLGRENYGLLGFFYRMGFAPSQRLAFCKPLR